MPRQACLDISGALHHIMVCGINISNIFKLKGGRSRRKGSTVRVTKAKRGMGELGLSIVEIERHAGVTTSSISKVVA